MSSIPDRIETPAQLLQEISSDKHKIKGTLQFGEMLVTVRSLVDKMSGELESFKNLCRDDEISVAKALVALYNKVSSESDADHWDQYYQIGEAMRNWSHFDLLDDTTKTLVKKTRRMFMGFIHAFFSRLYEAFHSLHLVIRSYPKLTDEERKILFKVIFENEKQIFTIVKVNTREDAIEGLKKLREYLQTMADPKDPLLSIHRALWGQIQSLEKELRKTDDKTFAQYKVEADKCQKQVEADSTTSVSLPKEVSQKVVFDSKKFVDRLGEKVQEAQKEIDTQLKDSSVAEDVTDFLSRIESNTMRLIGEQSDEKSCESIVESAVSKLQHFIVQIKELTERPQDGAMAKWAEKMFENFKRRDLEALREGLKEGKSHNFLEATHMGFVGGTILHQLAKVETCKNLAAEAIGFGCLPEVKDNFDNTPLVWAIANASNGAAMSILNAAGKGKYLDVVSRGNTALHIAVGKGYKEVSRDGAKLACTNFQIVEELISRP